MFLKEKENYLGIDWKVFYRNVFALVVPMALQNLINVGVTAADVIMLGRVGEKVLSGASLAGQIQYIMTLFLFGAYIGSNCIDCPVLGKERQKGVEKILGMIHVKAAILVSAFFTVAALSIPDLLMQIFTNDPTVIEQGAMYLRIVAFSYVLMGITQGYLYVMRSVERVVVATVVYLLSLLCNVVLNSIFIFGLLGCPAMGIKGAALGTLCARVLEVCLVAGYAKIFNKEIKLRVTYIWHTDKTLFSDFMKYSLPVVANEIMWGLGNRRQYRYFRSYGRRRWRRFGSAGSRSLQRLWLWALPVQRRFIWERQSEKRKWNMQKPMREDSFSLVFLWDLRGES